jgi:multiple sugar transport system ATP-binding protein
VLKDGVLQQVDTPLKLYDDPANLFVAGFIGSPAMNLLHARLTESGATVAGHPVDVPVNAEDRAHSSPDITIGIRPESFRVSDNGAGIPVTVSVVEELGADAYLYGVAEDEDSSGDGLTTGKDVVVRVEARRTFEKGSTVHVTADPRDIHVFETETGDRIGSRARA